MQEVAGQQRHARAARAWPEEAVEDVAADEVYEPEVLDDSDADPVSPNCNLGFGDCKILCALTVRLTRAIV